MFRLLKEALSAPNSPPVQSSHSSSSLQPSAGSSTPSGSTPFSPVSNRRIASPSPSPLQRNRRESSALGSTGQDVSTQESAEPLELGASAPDQEADEANKHIGKEAQDLVEALGRAVKTKRWESVNSNLKYIVEKLGAEYSCDGERPATTPFHHAFRAQNGLQVALEVLETLVPNRTESTPNHSGTDETLRPPARLVDPRPSISDPSASDDSLVVVDTFRRGSGGGLDQERRRSGTSASGSVPLPTSSVSVVIEESEASESTSPTMAAYGEPDGADSSVLPMDGQPQHKEERGDEEDKIFFQKSDSEQLKREMDIVEVTIELIHLSLRYGPSRRFFQRSGGWQRLYAAVVDIDAQWRHVNHLLDSANDNLDNDLPQPMLLGLLFSLTFNNDASLRKLFSADLRTLPTYPDPLPISSSLVISQPDFLPFLFDLLPLSYRPSTIRQVGLPNVNPGWSRYGTRHSHDAILLSESQQRLENVVWRVLIVVVFSSWTNLFHVHNHLPGTIEAILDRLVPESKGNIVANETETLRQSTSKISSANGPEENIESHVDSGTGTNEHHVYAVPSTVVIIPPAGSTLRQILLRLLRRLVEAGIPPSCSHRLFKSIRIAEIKPAPVNTDTKANNESPSSSPSRRPKPSKGKPPKLHLIIDSLNESTMSKRPRLDKEMLDIVRHGMGKRWPDMFCFSPRLPGEQSGSFICNNIGKPWPSASQGYYFTAWIYIEQLCRPITLLHLYEDSRSVLRIRILPNSQIGITTSPDPNDDGTEIIFQSADALVPHQQWVHFAIGGRKAAQPGNSVPEVKVVLDGKRTGIMKCGYPRPTINKPMRATLGRDGRPVKEEEGLNFKALEASTWYLGPTMLIGEWIMDDFGLLLHHLGPRYNGHLQDSLGRFLTYEGATALNIYLSNLVSSKTYSGTRPALPRNSGLIKAIKEGRALPEESIMFSWTASHGARDSRIILNGAFPTPLKTLEQPQTHAIVEGDLFFFSPCSLDMAISSAGGPLVGLMLVNMAGDSSELAASLSILCDTFKESWAASEEMERMHGFDILAGLLRAKMEDMMSVHAFKTLFSSLGISMDKPETATIFNSSAYRSIALRMDLWGRCPADVLKLYFQHFVCLMSTSHYKRFNVLKCFRRASLVRKLTHALKASIFDMAFLPQIIEVLRTALTQHWSSDDSIKPVFAFLVSSLCGSPIGPHYMQSSVPFSTPPSTQLPAAETLKVLVEILNTPSNLSKLLSVLPLHRVLIILLANNGAAYVAKPCLDILLNCLKSPGGPAFERKFDQEGGYVLLARVLALIWDLDIQDKIFGHLLGSEPTADKLPGQCLFPCLMAAFERLLQAATTNEEDLTPYARLPGMGPQRKGSQSSSTFAPMSKSSTPIDNPENHAETMVPGATDQLSAFLTRFNSSYRLFPGFRKLMTAKRVEAIIPSVADFISVSSSPQVASHHTMDQRELIKTLIELVQTQTKLPEMTRSQLTALAEQLRLTMAPPSFGMSTSLTRSPSASSFSQQTPSSIYMASNPSTFSVGSPGRHFRRPTPGLERRTSAKSRTFFQRTPLKRSLTGESVLSEAKDKNEKWKQSIIITEANRYSRTATEAKDFWKRVAQRDWPKQLLIANSDVGLWPDESEAPHWRLDGSEGPQRKRMKLELVTTNVADRSSAFNPRSHRNPIPGQDDLSSAVSRVHLTNDPFSLAMSEALNDKPKPATIQEHGEDGANAQESHEAVESGDEEILDDRTADDSNQYRRITKTLCQGDAVEEIFNISRVVGVDSVPGLLVCGKRHIYLIDGLVQDAKGEIIQSSDADQDLLTIPSGTLAELDASDQQSHRWTYNEVVEYNKRSFLFRDVALEFFFSDKRNFLCVFKSKRDRQNLLIKLASKNDPNAMKQSIIGTFVLDTVARAIDKVGHELENVTMRWQRREISNFAYLQIVNQYANRTPNDVTQYPVFPWILKDYTSCSLDLESSSTFRDLSLPMGALTPARRAAATERYEQSASAGEKPFQFGTHFSSSMIVCAYNIRVSPFTEMFLSLQGGVFDLADRLFYSIGRAWDSASEDNRGDVRELIPEFFYNPLFLRNINHHDFGRRQISDEPVDDVELPPWALSDPLLFIHRHREALESDYVSRNLPAWIDLIFGYKQHDAASYTCYHPLSYKDAIDLDAIDDEAEKAASIGIIHNFGQTPAKIFGQPHPHRFMSGRSSLPLEKRFGVDEHSPLLIRSWSPISESPLPMQDIFPNLTPDLPPQAYPPYRVPFGDLPSATLRFGFLDNSLRAYFGSTKRVCIAESTDVEQAVFVSNSQFATASSLGVITIWKAMLPNPTFLTEGAHLSIDTILRGHRRRVTHLTASDAWSILVSSSEDGTAIVWDMNRLRFLRLLSVFPAEPVLRATIAESEGHVALLCASHIHVFTLNGDLIASSPAPLAPLEGYSMTATLDANRPAFSGGISFFNKEFSKEGPLLAVGYENQVALWRVAPGTIGQPPWSLQELQRLPAPEHALRVSAVRFIGDALYACFAPKAGTFTKHVMYQWSLPEGGARQVNDHQTDRCMADCGRRFGLLEPRRHCGGCAGVFCNQDCLHIDGFNMRYCPNCRVTLALGMGLMGSRVNSRRGSLSVPQSRAGSRRNSLVAGALHG